ncbi:ACS family tartrate transporter-like MFS transporter [Neobacillus bataviensis]|uniref:ACS family tartrate transporter-like MFS transporter n=1 Tax=Neobacillus bataviensis TaxID=220685 RepID=A0A561CTZ3_9BACI|nr:MFS transporter [Neobacillus bataviensis]TWD94520.1 ACS family tartrate transporter-like MFS transporter [Neobacillus bataviensis]
MEQSFSIEKSTIRKVTMRILPYMFIAYLVAFLDRVSITYASIGGMDKSLHITSSAFGLLSGIFFIGYFLCEVPSNMLLGRFGARKWIARILITWGFVTVITAFASSITHLYILRFLLGVAEAGFFPGMILYITFWFRPKERARAVALFMTAPPLANAFGAPVSTWIVQHVHWADIPGWRWLFILAGIPAIILGFITLFYLTDRPENAKWLNQKEKDWLHIELKKEQETKTNVKSLSFNKVLKSKIVWKFTFINLTYVVGLYGISFWMPRIIQSLSNVLTTTQVGIITMIPYLCGAVSMVLISRRSDRTGERKYHAAFGPFLGTIGLIGVLLSHNPFVSVIMICIATAGLYSFSGPYWAFTSSMVTAELAVIGIGIINSIGNFGGFVGPYAIGLLNNSTGSVSAGIAFLALMLMLTSIQVMLIKRGKTPLDNKQSA